MSSILLFAIAGIVFALWLRTRRIGQPDPANWYNVFYVLFARNEPAGLIIIAIFALATLFWLWRGARAWSIPTWIQPRFAMILLLSATLLITTLGIGLVFHDYALTADEYMADFQARIFLKGKIQQELPSFWQPMARLILPTHAAYLRDTHSWMSSYLPVYSAIRTAFMSVGMQSLTNPICAGLSLIAIAGVARRIWPNEKWKPVLAAALLAASPQFLIMSMTAYAMPAHLCLNLIWLWLYSAPETRRFWLAPLVGVAALGLHQPFFHALFVAPFLVSLFLRRQWKATVVFALIYSLGIVCWFAWWHHFMPHFNGTGSKGTFGLFPVTAVTQSMYLALLLGWLAFPVVLLSPLGFSRVRHAPRLVQEAAISCLLTFGFYVFVHLDQGNGWGDRYFHGALGCLVLVAVFGWDSLAARVGPRPAATFAAAGLAVALLLQLPVRCLQAESFVRPYARAANVFHNLDTDLVVFEPRMAWYSADLRRNDPFLEERPIIACFFTMTEAESELLQKSFPRNRIISRVDLQRLGLATTEP